MRKGTAATADAQSSQFVSSVRPSAQEEDDDQDEEAKSMTSSQAGAGGWDQGYLEDVFGAIEDIDYDDELALEHLGELEYERQMSEQEANKKNNSSSLCGF